MLKNWVIDFQKSWIENYIVKNVIRHDVVSLYPDLLYASRLESKELDMQT